MATYVMADIHGEYDQFMELLEKIDLKRNDTLYVIGDVLDRGPHPIKVLLKMMKMIEIVPIVGNHEVMAMECLQFLMQEITEESLNALDDRIMGNLMIWQLNGGQTTMDEFAALDDEMKQEVIEYLEDFLIYEKVIVNNQKYLLVHAGLGNFSPDKKMDDYSVKELTMDRPNYHVKYFDDVYVVSGHTPTLRIKGRPLPPTILRANNHIAIDCGACFPNGRLAVLCLDTNEVFYSSGKK